MVLSMRSHPSTGRPSQARLVGATRALASFISAAWKEKEKHTFAFLKYNFTVMHLLVHSVNPQLCAHGNTVQTGFTVTNCSWVVVFDDDVVLVVSFTTEGRADIYRVSTNHLDTHEIYLALSLALQSNTTNLFRSSFRFNSMDERTKSLRVGNEMSSILYCFSCFKL